MSLNIPQNRSRIDIKHLYPTSLITSNTQFPIPSDLSTRSSLLEPRDGFHYSISFGRIDLESSTRSYDVAVRGGRREVDVSDWGVGFEEDWRLEIKQQRGRRKSATIQRGEVRAGW